MKMLSFAAALPLALGSLPANALTFAVVQREIEVERPAERVWEVAGDYCAIEQWLGLACVLTVGDGEVGTIRRLNDRLEEVLIAKGPLSYTYEQTVGGMAAADYHGTLAVEPLGENRSKIVYTLIWDEDALPEADRAATRERFGTNFQRAIEAIKTMAEAG